MIPYFRSQDRGSASHVPVPQHALNDPWPHVYVIYIVQIITLFLDHGCRMGTYPRLCVCNLTPLHPAEGHQGRQGGCDWLGHLWPLGRLLAAAQREERDTLREREFLRRAHPYRCLSLAIMGCWGLANAPSLPSCTPNLPLALRSLSPSTSLHLCGAPSLL